MKINESALVASTANYETLKKFLMDDSKVTPYNAYNAANCLRYKNILWQIHYNNIMKFLEGKGLKACLMTLDAYQFSGFESFGSGLFEINNFNFM